MGCVAKLRACKKPNGLIAFSMLISGRCPYRKCFAVSTEFEFPVSSLIFPGVIIYDNFINNSVLIIHIDCFLYLFKKAPMQP